MPPIYRQTLKIGKLWYLNLNRSLNGVSQIDKIGISIDLLTSVRVEWVLLWAKEWNDFANSTERQNKMKILTDLCHTYGHGAGAGTLLPSSNTLIDVPIAEQQQHTWYMTTADGTLEQQFQKIHNRLDWLYTAGFDFLSTENGYSEFTHPDDVLMLTWINETAKYSASAHKNKKTYIKVHCSQGQICPHYQDPWTHQPLNFNFLPMFSDSNMGVYPHTGTDDVLMLTCSSILYV